MAIALMNIFRWAIDNVWGSGGKASVGGGERDEVKESWAARKRLRVKGWMPLDDHSRPAPDGDNLKQRDGKDGGKSSLSSAQHQKVGRY